MKKNSHCSSKTIRTTKDETSHHITPSPRRATFAGRRRATFAFFAKPPGGASSKLTLEPLLVAKGHRAGSLAHSTTHCRAARWTYVAFGLPQTQLTVGQASWTWCGQPTGHENEGWKGRGFASKHKASCRPEGAWNTPLITPARACLGLLATPLASPETASKLDDDSVSRTGCINLFGNTFSISSKTVPVIRGSSR